MKKILLALVLFVFSVKAPAQVENDSVLVTELMASKISGVCLEHEGYILSVFYSANITSLKPSDIYEGKGIEVLFNLYEYPEYSENFIRAIHRRWGYKGLENIGFDEDEINICRKIIHKKAK